MNAAEAHQQELEHRQQREEAIEELLGDPAYVAWLSELLANAHTKVFNPNQQELFNNEVSRESRW